MKIILLICCPTAGKMHKSSSSSAEEPNFWTDGSQLLSMSALQITEGRGMDATPIKQSTGSSSYKVVQSAMGAKQHEQQAAARMTSPPQKQTRSRRSLYPGK
jgi:hypothetical protein